jgi:tRNA nucleotidyltransferase/poly(A) polymerase
MDEKGEPKGDKSQGGDKGGSTGPGGVSTSLKLGSNNDFTPFVVTDDPRNPEYPSHENLAPIIRAFKDSSKVKVYDSMDPKGQPKPHNLPQKKLFLVGGPVRDHLMKQTPKDLDLASDATPDEIRMILRDAGFKEINDGSRSSKSSGKNEAAPTSAKAPAAPSGEGTRIFYVKGRDQTGKDFVFGVKVNGQEFDLATFRKDHGSANDGRNPESMEFGSQGDDSSRRDLTINSMYLALTNDNGPNTDVSDFHGGVHALMNGNVSFVGNAEDRLGEDNLRALRYARFAAKFGKGKVDPQVAAVIKKMGPQIKQSVSPERVREEFLKGLGYEDVDPAKYIKIYKDLGLLDTVFPGMAVKLDKDEDYPQDRDPAMVIAHLLKGNDPKAIGDMMKNGKWSNQEQGRVGFLHDILNLSPASDPDTLDKHMTGYKTSGIMDKAVEKWWNQHNKGNPSLIQAFLAHSKGPRVQVVKKGDDTSFPEVDPDFMDLFDIMSGKPKPGMEQEVGKRKKSKEHQGFQNTLKKVSTAPKDKKDD